MRTKKLLDNVETLARSLAQRYDLNYDLVLAAVRQVLQKFKKLNEMNTIEKLTWQKKAGIISETQYREAVEALTSEDAIRKMIRESLPSILNEKKKKAKASKEETPPAEDVDMDMEDTSTEGDDFGMDAAEAPAPETATPQDVQKELMDALEAAKKIGDVKLQRQISNALTYFTRQQVAGSEGEASTAAPAL